MSGTCLISTLGWRGQSISLSLQGFSRKVVEAYRLKFIGVDFSLFLRLAHFPLNQYFLSTFSSSSNLLPVSLFAFCSSLTFTFPLVITLMQMPRNNHGSRFELRFTLSTLYFTPPATASFELQPNILCIMAYQLAAPLLKVHNPDSQIKTPRLNALAAEAVVFDSAHCPSPLCAPSRMSMVTSQLPTKVGAYDNACHSLKYSH